MVLESIDELCKKENIKNAVIVSGTGTLSQERVHRISSLDCPPAQAVDTIDNTPLYKLQGKARQGKASR